jgi:hypothetical protein
MDLRKTLSRLAVVPAAAAILPSFAVGVAAYRQTFRKAIYGRRFEVIAYPPDWQCALAGVAAALVAFLIVLFLFRGLVNLGFWITTGTTSKRGKPREYPSWPD